MATVKIQMGEYKNTRRHEDDHAYDVIKTENTVVYSRKQWYHIFLLTFTVLLVSVGLSLTVTYFTMFVKIEKNYELLMSNQNISSNEIQGDTMNNKYRGTIDVQQTLTESRLSLVESDVKITTKRVAITAFYGNTETAYSVSSGIVLKFSDVSFSVGIINLSSFKGTGKFVCTQSGLYLMSVSISSDTSGANFYIYLNGNIISKTHIAQHAENLWHTGTVIIARQLEISDSMWVQTGGIQIYGGSYSTFTIIKVK